MNKNIVPKIIPCIFALCASFCVVSCAITRQPTAIQFFVLDPTISLAHHPAGDARPVRRIAVAEVEASRLLRDTKIVFAKDSISRGWYQYAEWEEPVPQKLFRLIKKALEQTSQFAAVTDSPTLSSNAWSLKINLDEFYHDTKTQPGEVVVQLSASLTAPTSSSQLKTKIFKETRKAKTYDAHGAVLSMNEVVEEILQVLVEWIIEQTH
jgi:ABC-type uncharacterized transport system auxiliary subunit